MQESSYKPGDRLASRFIIEELIGKGATAEVYRAKDEYLGRQVALKIIPRREEIEERIKREIKTTALLNHPNIVTLYDFLVSDRSYIVVLEHVEGVSLRSMLAKRGRLPYSKVLYISIQIASALEAAHSKELIHKDIKPENILITKEGKVKIADFGIASLIVRKKEFRASGTLGYMSPEQITGRYIDETTDIFAVGVLMYELLTGKNPFYADTLKESALKTLNYDPEPPHISDPSIPEGLSRIVMKCISKDPDFRYQSASALKQALLEFQKELIKIRDESEVEPKKQSEVEKTRKKDYELIFLRTIYVLSLFSLVFMVFPFSSLIKGLPGIVLSLAVLLLGVVHPQSANWIAALASASLIITKNFTAGIIFISLMVIYLVMLSTYRQSLIAPIPFTEMFFSRLGIFPLSTFVFPMVSDTLPSFLGGLVVGAEIFILKAFKLLEGIPFFAVSSSLPENFDVTTLLNFLSKNPASLFEILIFALSCAFGSSVRKSIGNKNYSSYVSVISQTAFLTAAYLILNSLVKSSTSVISVLNSSIAGITIGIITATILSFIKKLDEKK
jgi:serine/threonine protein kinase